ncbi:MAG TPA: DUF3396 domain-containing protein [Gammaproteobacteria bacterium]|nr:DUF3396 domain-containing protein [Gammaproteobacteria bacterium]
MTIPENFTLEDLDNLQIVADHPPAGTIGVRLGLMCSLYMRDPHSPEVRMALAKCGDHYQQLFGEHLKCYIKPDGIYKGKPKSYPSQGINLVDYVRQYDNVEEKCFAPRFFGNEDYHAAAAYGMDIFAASTRPSPIRDRPAYFSVVLPFRWLEGKEGERAFQKLVHGWCQVLKPFHGYAGLGAIQSMDTIEKGRTNHLVYPLAKRFPGLDVDDPGTIASRMKGGSGGILKIKGVNWLTALDDGCFEQLGGREAVLADLDDEFKFYEYEGGVLIQAGAMPQMGDVNQQHIPRYYQQLARKLKPIRLIFPEGHYLIKSPNRNEQSNAEASNEWLARFD